MVIAENALEEIQRAMIRTLCRKASHVEAFFSKNKRVRIELTADRIKGFIICPGDDWSLYTARPLGKHSDQQFMSYAVQIAGFGRIKYCIYDGVEMTYTFRLGPARVVLSGPMSSLW